MDDSICIREAVCSDCGAIKNLIQELADFEQMPHAPKLSLEDLQKDGFSSKNPLFNAYVAVVNNKAIGFAFYFYTYYTNYKVLHLEDLYVCTEYRNRHIGSNLFKTVAKRALDENCQFIQFVVLSWNPAHKFYELQGAIDVTEKDGLAVYRIYQNSFSNTPISSCGNVKADVIRKAKMEDLDYIKLLRQEVSRNSFQSLAVGTENCDLNNYCYGYYVAELNESIIGYALYCFSYSTWEGKSMYLQELYVNLQCENDVVNQLFIAIVRKFEEEKCCWLDCWNSNSKICNCLILNGAVNITKTEKWHIYRCSV